MRAGIQKEKKKAKSERRGDEVRRVRVRRPSDDLNGRVNGGGNVVNTRDEGRAEQVG